MCLQLSIQIGEQNHAGSLVLVQAQRLGNNEECRQIWVLTCQKLHLAWCTISPPPQAASMTPHWLHTSTPALSHSIYATQVQLWCFFAVLIGRLNCTHLCCAATGMLQPCNGLATLALVKLNVTIDTCTHGHMVLLETKIMQLQPRCGGVADVRVVIYTALTPCCMQVADLRAGCYYSLTQSTCPCRAMSLWGKYRPAKRAVD